MSIVKITKMNKKYGERNLFQDFDLEVSKGEFVAIRGKSGAGKSTLLNIIGMLDTMDSGEMTLFDKSNPTLDSVDGQKILRSKLSYVFQNYALIDNKSVMYNMSIAAHFLKKGKKEAKTAIAEVLSTVGLERVEKKKIYELSGGEQQRVAIAMAMVKHSELILADEPTGNLDEVNRNHIMTLFKKMNKEGKTIIVVTHDMEVAKCANRVIEI